MTALLAILCAFTISWNPSPDKSVLGYRVYTGTASGLYTRTIDTGTATKVVLANPPAGQTTFAVVTAYAVASIESLPSREVSYTGKGFGEVVLPVYGLSAAKTWKPEYTEDGFSYAAAMPSDEPGTRQWKVVQYPPATWIPYDTNLVTIIPDPPVGVGPPATVSARVRIVTAGRKRGFVRLVPQ
jgi:hypothetical protein